MELKVKFLKWTAGLPVAMLSYETAAEIGIRPQSMVLIKTLSRNPKKISSVIDIIEDSLKKNEILVSSEIRNKMGLKRGQKVDVNLPPLTKSLTFIKKKLNGRRLSNSEINEIVKDVVSNSLSEVEISLFVAGMCKEGMTEKEIIYMIKAMLKHGNKLNLKGEYIVDKHSIGGVPGNRTTPIVVSICSAAGLIFPKTSSRAITSAAGTADVIETIARVDFSIPELKKIIKKTNAFMVWGGSLEMVPADSKILNVEKMLTIDPRSQLIASIMSKKLAVGSKYILIDIPSGKNAKISRQKAKIMKRDFQDLGRYFHKKLRCVITDGSHPIGKGIGPCLELVDVIKVLNPNEQGPKDLEDKALFLSGEILEMVGKAKEGKGVELAKEILCSGKAFEKFKEIIRAQEGSFRRIKEAKFKRDIISKHGGKITEVNNKRIVEMAGILGCPADKFSGIYLHLNVNDRLKKGDKIVTLYSETKSRIADALKFYRESSPFSIK